MPRFRPTDEQRRTAKAMAGFGIPQEDIATFLGIDAKTLRKHLRPELDRGSIEATTKVAQTLFRMATEGNNVAAAIFWMKARAGWREKPLPDEEEKPPLPKSIVIRWIDPEDVEQSPQFPNGRKVITRDVDPV